jgi:GT2 family glycosyltransferase
LLEECIPAVLSAIRATGENHGVLVVDNGSTDGSSQFVRERFPEVKVLELDRNYGFGGGNNRGVEIIDSQIVVLLNNDMVVDQGFLTPLLDGFTDGTVFAVTSQIFFENSTKRREETGKTRGKFERGFFTLWHDDIDSTEARLSTLPVLWAGGGSCAFDREKYRQMGGLDDLFQPFYVEDTDLSYQAWKRGWTCLLAPASRVVHKHRATSGRKYSHDFVDNTIRRNMYLFTWKNVTDASMLAEHLMNLPRIHASSVMDRGGAFEVRAYARAVLKLLEALSKRLRNLRHYRLSDAEVLMRSQQ